MSEGLSGKVCIVTGAARGIGRATAETMASRGANVIVADVNREGGEEVVEAVTVAGGTAAFVSCDMTERDQVFGLMDATEQRFGGIDVLVNNAGVHESDLYGASSVDTLPDEIWDQVMGVNLRGVWWATKACVPYLKRSTRGPAIVNAASTGGLTGMPYSAAYCASKAAVVNLTRVTAIDLAPFGIRCNCFCPGTIRTPMIERFIEATGSDPAAMSSLVDAALIPRLGEPVEIARLVCFLACDESSFINGAVHLIDGGKLAWRGSRST